MSYQPLFLGLGTAVVRTTEATGYLEAETANLTVGQPIVFEASNNSPLVGEFEANTLYFVKEIIDENNFTVSTTLSGPALAVTDDTGFMLVRAVQKENTGESLRKVDEMLQEIYAGVLGGDGVGILSVSEDTNPQLGGNLDLNSNAITGTGDIDISGSISATTITGNLRGVVAGGLIGPVDSDGLRIGNPTIDGLPFEIGNPQANQIIAWSALGQKFVLASLQAASGTDTLDDVLFRGNTSTQPIEVNGVTTTTLSVTNGIDYADLINTPSIPADISELTDTTNIIPASQVQSDWNATTGLGVILNKPTLATVATSGSYADLTNKPTIPSTLLGLGITDGTTGQVLTTNGAGGFTFTTISGGGGTGLGSRTTASATTGALAINGVGNISITGFKTYALLGMTVEIPAWVRLYTTAAARTADASRLETEDPLPGAGVIAEAITTSNNQTVSFTPATIGFNGDAPAATTIYASVKNKGSGLATIQVTLTLVQLEA